MNGLEQHDTTVTLVRASEGDASAAAELLPLVYDELRRLAAHLLQHERPDLTLQPTALVHEAYLRLVDQTRAEWKHRTHFFAVAAQMMRRVLVDHARARQAAKRGAGWHQITLDEGVALAPDRNLDVLAVDDALMKLANIDPRLAQVVELRFFAGLTAAEVAQNLRVSIRTVENDWRIARAWLRRELSKGV